MTQHVMQYVIRPGLETHLAKMASSESSVPRIFTTVVINAKLQSHEGRKATFMG